MAETMKLIQLVTLHHCLYGLCDDGSVWVASFEQFGPGNAAYPARWTRCEVPSPSETQLDALLAPFQELVGKLQLAADRQLPGPCSAEKVTVLSEVRELLIAAIAKAQEVAHG